MCYRQSVASSLHTPEDSLLRATSRRLGLGGVADYAVSFYLRLGAVGKCGTGVSVLIPRFGFYEI